MGEGAVIMVTERGDLGQNKYTVTLLFFSRKVAFTFTLQ